MASKQETNNLMAGLEDLLKQCRLVVKFPEEYGARRFPPDASQTPFPEIAKEIAGAAVKEFATADISMTLSDWERLGWIIERRIAYALYNLAYPFEESGG
jgi:hypothetical protein